MIDPKIGAAEKILGKEIVDDLTKMFKMIDADHSKEIDFDEVVKLNLYLDPTCSVQRIEDDAKLLFLLADDDKSGQIDLGEWLNGWAQTVQRTGSMNYVNCYVKTFNDCIKRKQISSKHVEFIMSFTANLLPKIMRWAKRAKDRVQNKCDDKMDVDNDNK